MPGSRFDTRPALVLLALLYVPALSPQSASPAQTGGLQAAGALNYIVEWRLIDAGKAKLTWNASAPASQPGAQLRLHLESTGLVSKLYKVNDDYTANLNGEFCVRDTHLAAHEGSRQRETVVHFDPVTKKASYLERDAQTHAVVLAQETDIPACVHDVIGGLFFLRTLNLEPGRSIQVPVSDGKKMVLAKVEAQARESIKVPVGTFKTIRYEAFLFSNVLYRRPGHLYVWLTDDARKLPVRLQVRLQFAIGTITFELEKEEKT
ncbi:MAG: DUF3108 domain-containing protein [Acidobacteriia bacterium]|nr:DUF3108 domain-containing protein [Terriglobia bacterium]